MKRHLSALKRLLPLRWIWGNRIAENYSLVMKSQWWPPDQLAAYQLARLKAVVRHAYTHSSFYRRLYESVGFEPGDFKTLNDFRQLPTTSRAKIQTVLDDVKSDDFEQHQPVAAKTGGTTGSPMTVYWSRESMDMRTAIQWRFLTLAGLRPFDRKLSLFASPSKGDFESVEDVSWNMMTLRTSRLSPSHIERIFEAVREYRPKALRSIVEYCRVLARYARDAEITDIRIPRIFVQGEAVFESDRMKFERYLGARTHDYYGMRENTASASECAEAALHINGEFTYLEFEQNGRPAAVGTEASVIGTNLHNLAFPLIRYDTGDVGRLLPDVCPCGRTLPTMEILGGRTRGFVVTRDELIYVSHNIVALQDIGSGIDRAQVYQPDIESLVLRVVRNDSYFPEYTERLGKALRDLTHGKLNVSVEFVDRIERTSEGKYCFIHSEVESSMYEHPDRAKSGR